LLDGGAWLFVSSRFPVPEGHVKQPIVLAYSGDFESTVAVRWLAEHYGADVVAITLDVGQSRDPAGVRERALAAGAVRAHVIDARDEFARDCVLPALQGAALDVGRYPQVIALAWPLIARKLIAIADAEGASGVAHASTSTAIDEAVKALRPDLPVVAAVREWNMTPPALEEWARARGVVPPTAGARSIKVDENLWGRTMVWSTAVDAAPPPGVRVNTTALDDEAFVEISFEQGTPVAINGVPMPLTELIESVSVIAGRQGVGRIERVETDPSGAVKRTIYEAPGAVVLHAAYANREQETGTVRLKLSGGQTVVSELVNHA
jgi:argininosuccinate synthase